MLQWKWNDDFWKIMGATCDALLGNNVTMVKWLKDEQFDAAVVDFFFGECGLALAYHTLGLGWVSNHSLSYLEWFQNSILH